ncbi:MULTISPECIES: hypothetical protein [Rhodococcus]|uniref:Uncharacterized protein n=1 Tax=Rhodococcus oxybenzonivorans TaxID=1990687 RepID=A0AAE4UWK1_9NOCA|nr:MULTISPECIES: hypothetical protein [Rhodococcus]MDV7243637.1 hypothetical protein [Rhodococcus oxybenzonivorans]MDV7264300.1 hypothetical protein [Rhodococcus oxybenzonivorans]MDV7275121.1 hypothetical protein [Rhodococcus oxybenzonivorans]MDV7335359.1 hypothetical protein [Rhodococcus oxybenzonivorans]MDV7346070.1 hypothetical protein [Rhodococcus oxybenzonivorans]
MAVRPGCGGSNTSAGAVHICSRRIWARTYAISWTISRKLIVNLPP